MEFNFNKCCIWIFWQERECFKIFYLTLTSVVFESLKDEVLKISSGNLTLTSVVFELF